MLRQTVLPVGLPAAASPQFPAWNRNTNQQNLSDRMANLRIGAIWKMVTKWCQQIHCAPCHRHPATTVELIVWNLYRGVPDSQVRTWLCSAENGEMNAQGWRPNILGFLNWRQMKSMPKLRSSNSRPGVGSLELFQHIHAPGNLSVSWNSLKAQGL